MDALDVVNDATAALNNAMNCLEYQLETAVEAMANVSLYLRDPELYEASRRRDKIVHEFDGHTNRLFCEDLTEVAVLMQHLNPKRSA